MADTFTLSGSYETHPTTGSPSAVPNVVAPVSEVVQLENKSVQFFVLDADAPVSVQFPAGFTCNVLVVKAQGGKARVRLTSADGSSQAVPVDTFLALISQTVGITAIDLTREPGVLTQVQVFLGDAAL